MTIHNIYTIDQAAGICYITIHSFKYGTHVTTIDLQDLPEVQKHNWFLRKRNQKEELYTVMAKINSKSIPLQRFILPPLPNLIIDHIDGNPLNNTRSNLRQATAHVNAHNRR